MLDSRFIYLIFLWFLVKQANDAAPVHQMKEGSVRWAVTADLAHGH